MKIPYFCCIGAELKRYEKDFDFMNQVYLYKVPTDDSIEEVLSEDYFKPISDSVLQDDLVYIYEASAEILHSCRFDKQNGHITAVPLASDETLTGAVTSIIHDNLTPNKLLKSDENGKVTVSDLDESDLITEARLQSEITRRAVIKDSNVVQEMQSGLKTPSVEVNNSLTVNGSAEFDNAPTTNDTTTYQNATSDSLVRKEQVDEVVQDIKTSSLTFVGYVSATEPSSATYAFNTGDLWLNSATMPTSFPFPQANIKEWNGSAWVAHSQNYTPANFDFFRNVNNKEGYYWFGGEWVVMSTDMSTTYFQLNSVSGKWEIKSNVNLPGAPTTTTPDSADKSTKIATTQFAHDFAHDFGQRYVSNCITKIPQDIKLELNNGTLTLKAGSKVYVPNGAGNFDELVIQNDLTTISSWGEQVQLGLFVKSDGSAMFIIDMEGRCSSGSTPPTATNIQMWYDTTSNLVKRYAGGSDTGDRYSLPIALVQKGDSLESSNISSIDQIFNGFGYIGSTVFALPGVKGLIPDGRNADGTLNNIKYTTTQVATLTIGGNKPINIAIGNNGTLNWWELSATRYDANQNLNYYNNVRQYAAVVGKFGLSNGQIQNFTPYNTFHAVDYSDTEFIAHQAMPSGRYVDLTLSAGTNYTAPADGYFTIRGQATAVNGYVMISNEAKQMANNPISSLSGGGLSAFLPVEKGDVVRIYHNNYINTTFRFIYANGAQ